MITHDNTAQKANTGIAGHQVTDALSVDLLMVHPFSSNHFIPSAFFAFPLSWLLESIGYFDT